MKVLSSVADELDKAIKEQIDSIEVMWAFEGYDGKLKILDHKDGNNASWLIGDRQYMIENLVSNYPIHSIAPFGIWAKENVKGKISFWVEINLFELGYDESADSLKLYLPEIVRSRESKGLKYNTMTRINFFEANTIEDIVELFQIVYFSNLKFGR